MPSLPGALKLCYPVSMKSVSYLAQMTNMSKRPNPFVSQINMSFIVSGSEVVLGSKRTFLDYTDTYFSSQLASISI